MEDKKPISYKDFTFNNFMGILQQNREKVIKVFSQTYDIQGFILEMLAGKSYAAQYAQFITENKIYERVFKNLKKQISEDLSQSQYQKIIKKTGQDLEVKFLYDDDSEQTDMQVSKIRQSHFQFHYEQKDSQQLKQQMDDSVKDDKEDNWNMEKIYKPEQDEMMKVSAISKQIIEEKKHQMEKSSLKKSQFQSKSQFKKEDKKYMEVQKQELSINLPESPQSVKSINFSALIVQVRYLKSLVDYQNYKYNQFSLKEWTEKYIRQYLSKNSIIVRRKIPLVKIMEEIHYVKSQDAGNYIFNPFCDALEIQISLKSKSNFDCDFTVEGDMSQLTIQGIPKQLKEWNNSFMNLTPKSTIDDLVKYVCDKRQATPQFCNTLTEGLKGLGGANTVQDLFAWQRSDFSNTKVKPTYMIEIQQVIEQIKDSCNIVSEKPIDQERKECLKTATSHKILRYVVYQTEGHAEVKKIAWLNMKNLRKAVDIVRREIHNQELLTQLQDYFSQFALDPEGKPLAFSRGMILYGPPGTGKTVLTEALPNIIGFHLIEKGLSAADFMKSIVGQSSRMIRDLVIRATYSPWLLCSIGIDEVDGLVPDRKDKDEKNKGEGISMMLSVIGGNKDVPNLTYMTSTNYIKKIDEAIGRRLNGKFQVGRPNPSERTKIIEDKVEYLNGKTQLMEHLIRITTNFTGAALGGLGNSLNKSLKIKKMNNEIQQITINEINQMAILIAKQFNINFGASTLPQIFRNQSDKKFVFTETFLKRISKRFLLVKHFKDNEFDIMYFNQLQQFLNGKLNPINEPEQDKIDIVVKNSPFESFVQYVKVIFASKNYEIYSFSVKNHTNYKDYSQYINNFLMERGITKKRRRALIIIQDHPEYLGAINLDAGLLRHDNPNLLIICYLDHKSDLQTIGQLLFETHDNRKEQKIKNKHQNYSGRIMVELDDEATRMAFELKNCMQAESKVEFRLFLKSQESNTTKSVIPELVDFFRKQELNYLLLIDYELLLQNDAFEEKKIMDILEEKMLQAKGYKRSAVIIDLNSLIQINENASDSNFGRSTSYSIQNYNLFQILLSYMREFASTVGGQSRWMTMILKHPELISMVKKQLSWPIYPEQIRKREEEEGLDKQLFCVRCGAAYTERENKKERKCMQHPGRIINTVQKSLQSIDAEPDELKVRVIRNKKKQQKSEDDIYIYACCLKGLNEQGEKAYYHITENQLNKEEDQLYHDKMSKSKNLKWNKVLSYFKSK